MYTKESIRALLNEQDDDDEIISSHTKAMLSRMYEAVYGNIGYPSGWREQDILRALRRYFAGIERAQRLEP